MWAPQHFLLLKHTLYSLDPCIFFFFLLIYFILFFNLTIFYWFCYISRWIRHRYTCVPHPEPSSLPPLYFFLILSYNLAQEVKNSPAVQDIQETPVQTLGREDPLEEEVAVHSSILAWKTPWTEEPSGLQSTGSQRVRYDWVTKQAHASTIFCAS